MKKILIWFGNLQIIHQRKKFSSAYGSYSYFRPMKAAM